MIQKVIVDRMIDLNAEVITITIIVKKSSIIKAIVVNPDNITILLIAIIRSEIRYLEIVIFMI